MQIMFEIFFIFVEFFFICFVSYVLDPTHKVKVDCGHHQFGFLQCLGTLILRLIPISRNFNM